MTMFDVPHPRIPVAGNEQAFPVHRIYCVGRNYAAHAREMGNDPDREPPFYFMKPADAVVAGGGDVTYPPRTSDLHHEVELVVAIGRGGRDIRVEDAPDHIFAYGVGIDLTRRDLQMQARKAGRPWDTGKSFEQAAPVSCLHPAADIGPLARGRIWLSVNDERRQEGDLGDMIWSVPEAIAELSAYFTLAAGDLLFTGTPAGVGAVVKGDRITAGIEGVDDIVVTIV
ncbi:MAG: fumarylacetoacetate hydrolase family protein [Gammaproteobacteria bacterium]|nr:fumarylacetoacetate hydrolase family protein [Gammaproteobacteria bacterium]